MKYWALILLPMAGIILYCMWVKVRGKTLEEIVDESAVEHHAIVDVFEEHPHGGTAQEYDRWLNTDKS